MARRLETASALTMLSVIAHEAGGESSVTVSRRDLMLAIEAANKALEHLLLEEEVKVNPKHAHYHKKIPKGLMTLDVYAVIRMWGITDPCDQHAIKKIMNCGGRGHKDRERDTRDVVDTMERKLALDKFFNEGEEA